jgi:hypothetical protein
VVGDRAVPAGEDGQRDQELLADALQQEDPDVAARPGAAAPPVPAPAAAPVPPEPAAPATTAAASAQPEPATDGEPTAGATEPAGV